MTFENEGHTARAIPKNEKKIITSNIKFLSIVIDSQNEEISITLTKAVPKVEKGHSKKTEQREKKFRRIGGVSNDSGFKKYFVKSSQQ